MEIVPEVTKIKNELEDYIAIFNRYFLAYQNTLSKNDKEQFGNHLIKWLTPVVDAMKGGEKRLRSQYSKSLKNDQLTSKTEKEKKLEYWFDATSYKMAIDDFDEKVKLNSLVNEYPRLVDFIFPIKK